MKDAAAANAEPGGTGARRVWNACRRAGLRMVNYDEVEANRLGVPIVGVKDFVHEHTQAPREAVLGYLDSLFPIRRWILSYNMQWLIGDLIAGITVALLLVPQSMSYASVAGLAPQYGLYSSFIGVMIYALFATSKDVTIGPVAVMSLQTHDVIHKVTDAVGGKYSGPEIASALAFLCGVITLGIGLLRLGWIVEFIPAPAVSGFMTGSALTILVQQLPKLFGQKGANTNESMYKVAVFFLRHLPDTRVDVAFGLSSLAFLYLVRWTCNTVAKRYPKYARAAFFISVLRSAFVIIVCTIATRLWQHGQSDSKKAPISLIGHVPRGFRDVHQPSLPTSLLSQLGPKLPASVILLLLEHISISKSFGRVNNYKINPNQELVAIGVTNLVGPCFGAYAATGSFSRSAVKSKSGVRTPVAGWITGIVVLIALYALAGVFQWIPNATLAAVIIHAVGDLIAPPALLYRFWLVNPLELVIWVAAVVVTIFTTVDYGVYTSVAASAALLLVRIARPRGHWLGVVRVEHNDPSVAGGVQQRSVFVPLDTQDGLRDPSVHVVPPPPGVLVYRVEESFTYPNASRMADVVVDKAKAVTRPGREMRHVKNGDRPWNDPGPPNPWLLKSWRAATFYNKRHKHELDRLEREKHEAQHRKDTRPLLHAIIFDFGSVGNVDSTSVQTLVDMRVALERYANHPVQFHFAHILSPWIRRALLAGGFGTGTLRRHVTEIASVVPQSDARAVSSRRSTSPQSESRPASIATLHTAQHSDPEPPSKTHSESSDLESAPPLAELPHGEESYRGDIKDQDIKNLDAVYENSITYSVSGEERDIAVPIMWNNELTPYFHLDLAAALSSACEELPSEYLHEDLGKPVPPGEQQA